MQHLEQTILVTWKQQITKFSVKGMNLETNTQWIQSYPCKTETFQETERTYKSFSSRRKNQKSFIVTNPYNMQSL